MMIKGKANAARLMLSERREIGLVLLQAVALASGCIFKTEPLVGQRDAGVSALARDASAQLGTATMAPAHSSGRDAVPPLHRLDGGVHAAQPILPLRDASTPDSTVRDAGTLAEASTTPHDSI